MSIQRRAPREDHLGRERRNRWSSFAAVGLGACLLLLASALAEGSQVLHFRDRTGVDHYLDQPGEVPPGAKAEPVDLRAIPLNQQTARGIERRAAETLTRDARKVPEGSVVAPPSREAQLYGAAAAALGLGFLTLTLLLTLARARLGGAAVPLKLLRALTGALAIVALAGFAYELRGSGGWFAEHFPPLKAYSHAKEVTDTVNAQRKASDQQIDRLLRGNQ